LVDSKGYGLNSGVVKMFTDKKFRTIYPIKLEVYFVEHSQALCLAVFF